MSGSSGTTESYQLSALSFQLSAVSYQPSAYQRAASSYQHEVRSSRHGPPKPLSEPVFAAFAPYRAWRRRVSGGGGWRSTGSACWGVGVQLGLLTLLVHGGGLHYLVATAIAVEITVLHNFIWHQHWTWRDRPSPSAAAVARRLARFHLLNGTVSLFGNIAIMAILCGTLRIDPVAANVVAIGVCSMLNFVASEVLVFKTTSVAATGMLVIVGSLTPSTAYAAEIATAELSPAAIAAWEQYSRQVDDRYGRAAASEPFFVLDAFKLAPGWRAQVMNGQVSMVRIPSFAPGAPEPSVPDGRVHHWAGAVFIPGVTLDHVLRYLNQRAGRESDAFDDVLSSRLISRDGDRLRVYMKLRRESVITVTYNTEHDVQYRRINDTRGVEPKRRDQDRGARRRRHAAGTREAGWQRPRLPLAAQCLLALRAGQWRRPHRVRIGEPQPRRPAPPASVRDRHRRTNRQRVPGEDTRQPADRTCQVATCRGPSFGIPLEPLMNQHQAERADGQGFTMNTMPR